MSHHRPPRSAVPGSAGSRRYADLLACLALAALAAVLFLPSLRHGFVYDDGIYLTQNAAVGKGLSWAGIRWAFTTTYFHNWHPLTWISHMAAVEFFGLRPFWHHLLNLVIHLANIALLFLVLRRATGAAWQGGFAAALWAVHPLNVESVAWVSERKGLLSVFFALVAVAFFLRHARRRDAGSYAAALLFFGMGLMCKALVLVLPAVLLVLDHWPLDRFRGHSGETARERLWRAAREIGPFAALSAISAAATFYALQHGRGISRTLEQSPFWTRLGSALVSYAFYAVKLFWPADLSVIYPYPGRNLSLALVAGSAALLLAVSAAAVALRKGMPWLLAGWLWYLLSLAPVVGLFQANEQIHADRYAYLPLVGLLVALVWGVSRIAAMGGAALALSLGAGLVFLATLAVSAGHQLRFWHDEISLFERALAVTRGNHSAHQNLGIALVRRGRIEDGIGHYREALRIKPDSAGSMFNLGMAYVRLGRKEEAMVLFREALRIEPQHPGLYNELGLLSMEAGRLPEAADFFRKAVAAQPDAPQAYFNLALAYARLGERAAALQVQERLRSIDPSWAARLAPFLGILGSSAR